MQPRCCWTDTRLRPNGTCGRVSTHKIGPPRSCVRVCKDHFERGDSATRDLPPLPKGSKCLACSASFRGDLNSGICPRCLSDSSPHRVTLDNGFTLKNMSALFSEHSDIAMNVSPEVFGFYKESFSKLISETKLESEPELPYGFQIGFPTSDEPCFTLVKTDKTLLYTLDLDNTGNLEIRRNT